MSRTPTPAEQHATESRERLEHDMWRIFTRDGVTRYLDNWHQQKLMADLLDAIDDHAGRLGDSWTEQMAAEARLHAATCEHTRAPVNRKPPMLPVGRTS